MDQAAFKPRWLVAALLMPLAFASATLSAQDADLVSDAEDVAVDETSRLWFVELASAPMADGSSATTLNAEKNAFRAAAANEGLQYQERYSYSTLWNGVSVEINASDVSKLARVPGVKAVYPVVKFTP